MEEKNPREISSHLQEFNLDWFSKVLEATVESIEWEDLQSDGAVSNLTKVKVIRESQDGNGTEEECLVMKQYLEDSLVNLGFFQNVGLAREADFYNSLKRESMDEKRRNVLREMIPKVYFAESDAAKGRKVVLMQDLSVGGHFPMHFFSLHHPFNVGKEELIMKTRRSVVFHEGFALQVVKDIFVSAANLHAAFWNHEDLAQFPWARGLDWLRNEGMEKWLAMLADFKIGPEMYGPDKNLQMFESSDIPKELQSCLKSSYSKLSWESFLRDLQTAPRTLTHGDLHAGNVMWMKDGKQRAMLFDWENVGWGSGPAELCTFVIWSLDLEEFNRELQLKLLRSYYDQLVSDNPAVKEEMNFDLCLKEYVYGGFQYCISQLPFMIEKFPEVLRYCVGQLNIFREDHGVVPEKLGPPRF